MHSQGLRAAFIDLAAQGRPNKVSITCGQLFYFRAQEGSEGNVVLCQKSTTGGIYMRSHNARWRPRLFAPTTDGGSLSPPPPPPPLAPLLLPPPPSSPPPSLPPPPSCGPATKPQATYDDAIQSQRVMTGFFEFEINGDLRLSRRKLMSGRPPSAASKCPGMSAPFSVDA